MIKILLLVMLFLTAGCCGDNPAKAPKTSDTKDTIYINGNDSIFVVNNYPDGSLK